MSLKNSSTETAPLQWNEAQSLLNNLIAEKRYNTALMCSTGFFWGLRIGDILSLTWGQIIQQELTIIEQKTSNRKKKVHTTPKKRTLTHSEKSYAFVKIALDALPVKPDKEDFVFIPSRNLKGRERQQISVTAANKRIRESLEKYAIKTKNPSSHTLRKTFARKIYDDSNDKGKALVELMDILNHSSLTNTKKYIGLTAQRKKETYESIGGGKVKIENLITL